MVPNSKIISYREDEMFKDDGWPDDYPRSRLIRTCYYWHKQFYGDEF